MDKSAYFNYVNFLLNIFYGFNLLILQLMQYLLVAYRSMIPCLWGQMALVWYIPQQDNKNRQVRMGMMAGHVHSMHVFRSKSGIIYCLEVSGK